MLMFSIKHRNHNETASAIVQVRCLRTGYRSVALKNNYSEDLELAALLVHIRIAVITVRETEDCTTR